MYLVSDGNIYRCLVFVKDNIPVKSGNAKHNATGIFYIRDTSAAIGVDITEANYMKKVLKIYQDRGDDFMKRALLDVYVFLNDTLNGGDPTYNEEYQIALQSALGGAKSTVEREVANILYGTGQYGSEAAKEVLDQLGNVKAGLEKNEFDGRMLQATARFGGKNIYFKNTGKY